ncbi:11840_t:CDS:2 [Rhizophagus irregularis]|nr:11840_t:CDS:2 [Rhizophagus irregularis]
MLFRWHFHLEQNRSIDICNAFKKDFDDIVDTPIDIQFHPDSKYIKSSLASQSQNISKISINSLGNSDEAKISLRKAPTYAESLRKQYQASTFYYTEPESYLDDDVPPIPPMPTSIKSEIDKKIEEKNTDLKKINEKIYYNDINNRSKQIENDIIIKPNSK